MNVSTVKSELVSYVRGQLQRQPEKEPLTLARWAKRALVWFFAVFVALTFLSRCASDVLAARVRLKDVSSGSIDRSISGQGVWTAAGASFLRCEYPGLRIARIYVSPGSKVLKGDKLFSYEEQSIARQQTQQLRKLQQYDLQIQQLQAASGDSTAGAALTLKQAKEDLQAAKDALSGASAAIDALKLQEYEAALSDLTQQTSLRDGQLLAAQTTVDAARAALDPADAATQTALDEALASQAALSVQWAAAIAAAQERVNAAQAVCQSIQSGTYDYSAGLLPYEAAVSAAQRAVDTAKTAHDQAVKSSGSAAAGSAAQISSISLSRATEQEKMDILTALSASGGLVCALNDGTVTAVNMSPGDLSTEDTAITLSAQGLNFTFTVSDAQAQQLQPGDAVTLYTDAVAQRDKLTVAHIDPVPGGGFAVVCTAPPGVEGSLGAAQDYKLQRSSARQDLRLPIQALREDGTGKYYVLVLSQRDTVLGAQSVARRVDVELLSHDESFAAVDGALSQSDKLIVYSDRPLADGDRVEVDDA